ncbi:Lrp/AsnC ligand binding domain-containing protein [Nitrosopumilus sp.]|uniref:Lrp/AsnC family transcriptional regulator n=1 Tax=Nitrosopumilus sp. TaxID=2024843 RepID=UPI00293023BA|nr:Lrp/AsnC ligand binding domain-containing protein [Nitrosopumilus sp.]
MVGSFILLNCKKNQEKNVIAYLKEISEVKEIQCVSGPYDILVKIQAPTVDELHEIITWKIRKLKNVRSTYTLKINEEATDCKDDNS